MRKLILLLTLFFFFSFDAPQINYPQDIFGAPIKNTLRLSGTFGELRPNHFHAGIDIKGGLGQTLIATANGYISRIKIQKDGYGNVLYFNHPKDYISVYAHMDKFMPEVEAYVRKIQYEKQRFEVEIIPPKDKFTYQKGDKVGTMGTTGRSFGPHLHFEIRDTKTGQPINPLLFGLEVEDTRAPRLHELRLYGLNDKDETIEEKTIHLIQRKNGDYRISGDTVKVSYSKIGLALKTYDTLNGASNWNGIYALNCFVEDSLSFGFKMETFPLEESRYINAHLDYKEQVSTGGYFNRCFILPGNKLSIIKSNEEKGILNLKKEKKQKIEIEVADLEGNESVLKFWVKLDEKEAKPKEKNYNYFLPFKEENIITTPSLELYFPSYTFYENIYFSYSFSTDVSTGIYSSVHHVHNFKTPTHKYFELSIWPNNLPDELSDKAFIAYCNKENEIINCGGQWEGDMLKTKVRTLGDYYVMADNIPPKIEVILFKSNMKGYKEMKFKISDNFQAAGNVKGLEYYATIDGKWILMKYDEKNNLIHHTFDASLQEGEHRLLIELRDALGNKTLYDRIFYR